MTWGYWVTTLKKTKTKRACCKQAYYLLTARYHGQRLKTYLFAYRIFEKKREKILKRKGFLHCTSLNFLLRELLLESGKFSQRDIRTKWTLTWWISPHQYLEVRTEDGWQVVDCWGKKYGIPYGKCARGFA